MTADQAKAIADYFATMFDQEIKHTLKVLRAVPNDRRDYKPDEKSRTAWDLVTHLVGSDLWFLDSVCDAVFVYDEAGRTYAALDEEAYRRALERL